MLFPSLRFESPCFVQRQTVLWLKACQLMVLLLLSPSFAAGAATLRLNEIAAANTTYLDEDLESPDWVEIQNLTGVEQDLTGWYLTDDSEYLLKWSFPAVSIAPNGFLVVFASGKDRRPTNGEPLHANFRLNSEGEFVALVTPDGMTIEDQYKPSFPAQRADVSYGYSIDGASQGYFHPSTPGAANALSPFSIPANEVSFSHRRGYYDETFELELSASVAGSAIYFTLGGTTPNEASGTLYTNSILIAPEAEGGRRGTRIVRATAIHSNAPPSPVSTHTFLFTTGVTNEPRTDGIVGQPSLTQAIALNPVYAPQLEKSLKAIPVISVVIPGGGLTAFEQPTSVEFFDTDGLEEGFQIDAGINFVGGHSEGSPKKSFRLYFRSKYGVGQLKYPLFEGHPYVDEATDRFEQLHMRSGSHDTFFWLGNSGNPPTSTRHGDAQYLRNRWVNDMQFRMGHESLRGRFVQVYLNGIYHGQYQIMERPNHQYHASYFEGEEEDFHFTNGANSGKSGSDFGDGDTWQTVWAQIKGSVPDYELIQRWVDMENLVDYMLLGFYGGNTWDWNPNQNWMAGGPKEIDRGGWKFYGWDSDIIFQDVIHNNLSKQVPDGLFHALLAHEDFRILLQDRIQKHFFHDGLLTPEQVTEPYAFRADQIRDSLIMETARWQPGGAANPPWDRDGEWLIEYNHLTNIFFQQRTEIVLDQFHAMGWFPMQAPVFSHLGGEITPAFQLVLTHTNLSGTIYFTLDGTDPRLPGGEVSPSAQIYSGPIVPDGNVHVRARFRIGTQWSAASEATFTTPGYFDDLAITEIMYHPRNNPAVPARELEFVELKNTGDEPLDLSGVAFTRGLRFEFTNGASLGPGEFFVLARNAELLDVKYPGVAILGNYRGNLNDNGDTLELSHRFTGVFLAVDYDNDPPWPITADGYGFSLVPVDPGDGSPVPSGPTAWRASSVEDGSPGADDPLLEIPQVLVNELISAGGAQQADAVELLNPTEAEADIGGWFLTDDPLAPRKFRIPDGTGIPAGGFAVFTEDQFGSGTGDNTAFAFNSRGDAVYLLSGDVDTNLTGYGHGFEFEGAAPGVSFGRYVNSAGVEQFPAQVALTLTASNAGPRVGPVVISEIHYAPTEGDESFVELQNLSLGPVPLYDLAIPTNTWRLRGLGYDLPDGTLIPGNGLLLIVGIDPDLFRTRYNVPAAVPIAGPYPGRFRAGGESLALQRPTPPAADEVAYITVDAVDFSDQSPWPLAAAGAGASLQRIDGQAYANDPTQWTAAASTPGAPYAEGAPPSIVAQPVDHTLVAYFDAQFEVTAQGIEPLRYQWRHNGVNLPGATTSQLVLTNVQPQQRGEYEVVVFDANGTVESEVAVLTVLIPAEITMHPLSQNVRPGATVFFSVAARSTTAMTFQWFFNDQELVGATNSSYAITNVVAEQEGDYSVTITDGVGPVTSRPARMIVLFNPTFVQQPHSLTVVEGSTVSFGVAMSGTQPFGYRWRRNGRTVVGFGEGESILTVPNVTADDAGRYNVVVTNLALLTPGVLSGTAFLTVLTDSDGDLAPDDWETVHEFDPVNGEDGGIDTDGDGLLNWQEFVSGTDPRDALSVLRVDHLDVGAETIALEFLAYSNQTYSVEWRDSLGSGDWIKLSDVEARGTNRVERLIDPNPQGAGRLYRLVTPLRLE